MEAAEICVTMITLSSKGGDKLLRRNSMEELNKTTKSLGKDDKRLGRNWKVGRNFPNTKQRLQRTYFVIS